MKMQMQTQTNEKKVPVDLGLEPGGEEKVAEAIGKVLADTYVLYLKTQNFHWNVTGPHFSTLHNLFEMEYKDLANAVDALAERIRAIGRFAPGSYAQFLELTEIREEDEVPPAARMIEILAADHEHVVRRLRETLEITESVGDAETGDMMIKRMQVHGKSAWMLRSHLQ